MFFGKFKISHSKLSLVYLYFKKATGMNTSKWVCSFPFLFGASQNLELAEQVQNYYI